MKANVQEYIVMIVIGLFFTIIGFFMCRYCFNTDGKQETMGVITRIDTHTEYNDDGGSNTTYDVFVRYEANGRDYESNLGFYKTGFYEGKEIKVYYNKEKPSKVYPDPESARGLLIFPVAGSALAIAGIILLIVDKVKEKSLA